MKIAVTGKGGVGKTTIIALIGRVLRDRQDSVLFIDADPDMNLATVIGIPPDTHITPIIELQDLIAERTGVTKNTPAPLFKMNPKVDDIPDRYAIEYEGFKLFAGVNNMLNELYSTSSFSERYYPMPGRNFYGGLEWTF